METRITTFDELKLMAQGEVVNLPPAINGTPLTVRLRRPSLLKLAKNGNIPNRLLRTANMLFGGNVNTELDADDTFMKDLCEVLYILAEASLIEPSWSTLEKAKYELTDQQLMAIFNYTQEGVESLEPFRELEEDSKSV